MAKSNIHRWVIVLSLLLLAGCTAVRDAPGQASFDRGLAFFNQGNFEAAIPQFRRASREDPSFAEAYFYLGRSYVSLRRWREAIPPLRSAYQLAPEHARDETFNLLLDAFFAAALGELEPDRAKMPPERLDDPPQSDDTRNAK